MKRVVHKLSMRTPLLSWGGLPYEGARCAKGWFPNRTNDWSHVTCKRCLAKRKGRG